ncbi:hypothetical protein, partial [Actinoplanes sp. ATCC 53533]|uniref:hypothetical protein n=1 Tax=Actinoplanes sp. ATCC 53533 TaxID=1288362 RepID=UPI001F24B6E0
MGDHLRQSGSDHRADERLHRLLDQRITDNRRRDRGGTGHREDDGPNCDSGTEHRVGVDPCGNRV